MRYWLLIGLIVISNLTGALGSLVTDSTWYAELAKPALSPPSWVFGPVWTLLYTLIGIAAYFAWENKTARYWYFGQLVLNALWTPIFFGLRNLSLALVIIVLLLASIIITTYYFFRTKPIAGWLMLPYILWVSFATYLTFGIWLLN